VRAYPSAVGLALDPGALGCGCLIADLVMPGTDAIQLLAQLQTASWRGKSILISGLLDLEWRPRAIAAGYDAVLAKPISESVLVRTLNQLLSKQAPDRAASVGDG
jgi:FixJ family two-component response regulator